MQTRNTSKISETKQNQEEQNIDLGENTNKNNSENEVYVIARVPFSYISASTGSQENGLHYVNVNGELVTDENDITWLKVGPTSTNDGPARTINDNWKSENGNMYVKVSAVEKIVVLE